MSFLPEEGSGFGGLFKQGAFQLDQNTTPEMLARKREALAAMMPRYGQAKYVGEGIGQFGHAIASNRQNSAMDKFEGEKRQEAAGMFNNLMTGQGATAPRSSGPLSILGMAPGTYTPPGPANPNDAKYPTGQEGPAPQGNIDPASGLSMGEDAYAAIPEKDGMSGYIMQAAQARGIDPQVALAVARSEGLNGDPNEAWQSRVVKNGKRERSYGPFQLYIDGGLGNSFMQDTGLDPRDPTTWQAQIDYALDHASKNGWGAWYGARNTGIGNMQGIGGAPQQGGGSFAPGEGYQVAQNTYAGGPQLNDLAMMAQNPWLTPEQRAVINQQIQQHQRQQQTAQDRQYQREQMIWEQQLNQSDPLYQAKIAEAQRKATTGGDVPSSVQELQWRAAQAGLQPGTPEYQSFVLNGGGEPATFRALDMQAQRAGFAPGTPEYQDFMATRGAGLQAGAKVTAENLADVATGGAAEGAKALGTASMEAGVSAWQDYAKLQSSIGTIGEAITAIDSGAESGLVNKYLPNITEASASLNNAMDRMGLDVVGSVTFGALSEGELRLAMNTAAPRDLSPPELRNWLVKKQAAQQKASAMLADAAQYLTVPGQDLNGWIAKNRAAQKPAEPERKSPASTQPTQVDASSVSSMSEPELTDYLQNTPGDQIPDDVWAAIEARTSR